MSHRTFIVERTGAGQALADWLAAQLDRSRADIQKLLRAKRVRVAGTVCSQPTRKLRTGQRIEVHLLDTSTRNKPEPPNPRPKIVFGDEHILVVEKPSGLTTMRHKEDIDEFGDRARFLPPTLEEVLAKQLGRTQRGGDRIRSVHRLDKDTTGLLVFARNAEAESELGKQLRAHSIDRLYHALVRGRPEPGRIESTLVKDRGDGRRGSSPDSGKRAVTHVSMLEQLGDFSLVECRLETGRTHQVRIHLGEAGAPLCGERIYDRPIHGKPIPDPSGAQRVMLHACTLGLIHPATGDRLSWSSLLPEDMSQLLERLRRLNS